jgi:hypothetical protein
MVLEGAAILSNVGPCFLTQRTLQLFPTLDGETNFNDRVPEIFTPKQFRVVSEDEVRVLKQVSLLHDTVLDQLSSNLSAPPVKDDVNTLMHIHASVQSHSKDYYNLTSGLIAAGSIFAVFIMYYLFRSHCQLLVAACIGKCSRKVIDPYESQQHPVETVVTSPPNSNVTRETQELEATPVRFSTYSMQST